MNAEGAYATTRIEAGDTRSGFRSGVHALDDYFTRHALVNDVAGVGRAYVLRRSDADDATLPEVLGFYTLSMAQIESKDAAEVLKKRLPRYPLPAALIGRLAVDERARGRRLGECLLIDALRRVVDTAAHIGCVGIVVDAKEAGAGAFYAKYNFVEVEDLGWPRRMFMALETARSALSTEG